MFNRTELYSNYGHMGLNISLNPNIILSQNKQRQIKYGTIFEFYVVGKNDNVRSALLPAVCLEMISLNSTFF